MKKALSITSIFLASFFWGISGIFVRKLATLGFNNNEVTFLRFLFSAIIICVFYAVFNKKAFSIKVKDIWVFVCSGVLGMFFTSLLYFLTMRQTSISVACILMYTSPIFVTILSRILFKEKFTSLKIICLITTFTGCIMCSYDGSVGNISLTTFLIGLSSGIAYASYSIFSRLAINKGYTTNNIILYSFIFGAIISTFTIDFNHLFNTISVVKFSSLNALWLAFVSTVLPYMLYTFGLKNTDTSKASIIACMEIVFASLVGIVLFEEVPTLLAISGLIVVIVSVIVLNLKITKTKEKNND